jgi:hypothetical protein
MKLDAEEIGWLKLVSEYLRRLADMEPRELYGQIRGDGHIDVNEDRVRREPGKEIEQ